MSLPEIFFSHSLQTKPTANNRSQAKISVIIPTLNEAANIANTLQSIMGKARSTTITGENGESKNIENIENIEIIIVDGGSQDETLNISQATINQLPSQIPTQIISCQPGRAQQMNQGAKLATGEIFLFLHADTQLPPNYDKLIRHALIQSKAIAGAFTLKINAPQPSLRLIEWGVKMRSQYFQLPYGDQAIFITREIFEQIGGFANYPIMEDFILVRQLQKLGKIALIQVPVTTSPRRWLSKGIWQTTFINQMMIIGYYLGISPQRLRNIYRGISN